MRNYERRLKKLERQLLRKVAPVVLIMSDGSREQLRMPRGGMLQLYAYLIKNEDSREAELLRKSIRIIEPGGGHMMELARALLHGPAVEETGEN
jgi:hypothetical protein